MDGEQSEPGLIFCSKTLPTFPVHKVAFWCINNVVCRSNV